MLCFECGACNFGAWDSCALNVVLENAILVNVVLVQCAGGALVRCGSYDRVLLRIGVLVKNKQISRIHISQWKNSHIF